MNRLIFALLLLFASNLIQAQGFIFRWNIGYAGQPNSSENIPALAINTQTPAIDQWTNLANINDALGTNQTIHSSYGQGINVGLRVGYMFSRYIGIDLGVTYTGSITMTASQTRVLYLPNDTTGVIQPSDGYLICTLTTQSHNLSLSPSVMGAYDKPNFKIFPYARFGVVLPVWTQIDHSTSMNLVGISTYGLNQAPYFLGSQTNVSMQTNGAFAIGFNGAIGAKWRVNPFTNLVLELNGQYLSLKATSTTITSWVADGTDLTANRGLYRTQFDYVSKLGSSSNNAAYNSNYNPNLPKQELSPTFPFSNIGFNVGVELLLNSKIFKDKDRFEETRKRKKAKPKTEDTTTPSPSETPAQTPKN